MATTAYVEPVEDDICMNCGGSGFAPHGAPGDCTVCDGTGYSN